jgi:ABC-type glycerol-3-phosphate transport system substrate-binding protein
VIISALEACGMGGASAPGGASASAPGGAATPNLVGGGQVNILQFSSYVPASDQKLQELCDRWAAQHSGWTVNIDFTAQADLQTKISSVVQAGAGPDIIEMQYNWPWLYPSACLEVSDSVARIQKANGSYYDMARLDASPNGQWLGIPYTYITNAWIYRSDLWAKVGKPNFVDSLDDLLTYGKQLKTATGIPWGQSLGHAVGDASSMWYGVLWGFGGQEVETDGKTVAINSPETEAALNWAIDAYYGAMDPGSTSWDDSGNNRAYAAKTISATENGASIYLNAKKSDPSLAAITSNAIYPTGPKARATIHESFSYSIMKWTKNQDAAKDLIEYLMQKDIYSEWMTAGGGYYSYPGSLMDTNSVWTADPAMKPFNDVVKYGRWPGWPGPPNKAAAQVQTNFVIVDMFATAVKNKGNVAGAIAAAEQQLNQIYRLPA